MVYQASSTRYAEMKYIIVQVNQALSSRLFH
ncbi:hypothetical protein QFZ81_002714 [Paenibacillus sp. V4I9]|nr:hypothetical protein [Paenibacillus sp. V4I9]